MSATIHSTGNEVRGQGAFTLARRRYQTGELFLRGKKNPVWVGRWREDVVTENNTLQKRVYRSEVLGSTDDFPTKRLANRALQQRLERVNSLSYKPLMTATFREFSTRWQDSVLLQHKPATQITVKSQLKRWLEPFFGDVPMHAITPEMVQRFAATKASASTIRTALSYLGMMWNSARVWGYASTDVMENVIRPRKQRVRKLRPFTAEEIKLILEKAEDPYCLLYWLLAETGMRIGEATGLHKSDFNLKNRQVIIQRSVFNGKEQAPKTPNAIRRFAISEPLRDRLQEFLKPIKDDGLLFATRNGTPWNQSDLLARRLHPLLEELKLEQRGFHAFRHGNASMLDSVGAPVAVRLNRLGHAEFDTTMLYTHQVSADELKVSDQISLILHPNAPKSAAA